MPDNAWRQPTEGSDMSWDFSTDPDYEAQLEWARAFVREHLWPLEALYLAGEIDTDGLDRALAPLKDEVRARGLWATHLPAELGGQGHGQVKLGLLHEVLGTCVIAPLCFGNSAPDSGNSEILALAGTPEQKERWLEPLLAGDIRSAFSMTEPHTAGSDPTLLQTTAVRTDDGDEYVINGRKWFSSNATVADFLIVMAVTDPDARPHQRASMIIVPVDTPGVNILRDVPTMEHPHIDQDADPRWGGHAEILYEDCRVPASNLLGQEGEGFLIAQHRLVPGRIHHCMRWLGQAGRAFDMLCERALSREAHGGPLSEKQSVQNWIADSAAEMQAARLMTLHAAWLMDTQGASAAREAVALIKFYGANVLHGVIDRAIQVHGSLGFSADMPLERMYRHSRAWRLYDGPDEVHRQSVARRILRGYEPHEVPSDHVPTMLEGARERFADLLEAVTSND
jgi:acyl-CoA dehydrogenase